MVDARTQALVTAALIAFAILSGLYISISQVYKFYALWLQRNHQIDSELALSGSPYPASTKEVPTPSPMTKNVPRSRPPVTIVRPRVAEVPQSPTPRPTPPPKPQPTYSPRGLRSRQESYPTTPFPPVLRAPPARWHPGRPRAVVNFASNDMAAETRSKYDELRTFDPMGGSEASPEGTERVPLAIHNDIAGSPTETRNMISPTFTVSQLHTPMTGKRTATFHQSRQTTPNLYQSATASIVSDADSPLRPTIQPVMSDPF